MQSAAKRILVVGGNGFIGSAVCKAALARGFQVTSVSSSGKPFRTAKGHSPAWTSKVDWRQGDALKPQTFAHLFPEVDGVVHTLGTLFENASYKEAVRSSDPTAVFRQLFRSAIEGAGTNPLQRAPNTDGDKTTSYETINRDSALRVCEAFISSTSGLEPKAANNHPRPFIYVSAEDIFRPIVPARYIETKWEAERRIAEMMQDNSDFRGVFIRPSLVYHAHYRPLTTPAAVLLDISATIHSKIPRSIPTPSSILRSLGGASTTSSGSPSAASIVPNSALESVANALTVPPIHVDQVADAICVALDPAQDVRGVVGVRRMRELIGWTPEADRGSSMEMAGP